MSAGNNKCGGNGAVDIERLFERLVRKSYNAASKDFSTKGYGKIV